MSETTIADQAKTLVAALPALMRQLFAMENDPAEELPLGQLRLCVLLIERPRPMSALSRELKISLSAMTQLADRMERAGLVERVAEGSDRRVRKLQLTPRGEKILRYREKARMRRVTDVVRRLPPRTRYEILAAFRALSAACEESNNHHPPALSASGMAVPGRC
jgi:MarR family transcriptional regulator, transcriptional regulator for hemolysin